MDLDMRSGPAGSVGEVVLSGRHWPVYSLDRNLDLIGEIPRERHICVLVSGALGGFGITCDELTTLKTDDVSIHPVPGCMCTPDLLAESLAVYDGRVACVLSAESIARRIERLKPGEPRRHSQGRPAEVGAVWAVHPPGLSVFRETTSRRSVNWNSFMCFRTNRKASTYPGAPGTAIG